MRDLVLLLAAVAVGSLLVTAVWWVRREIPCRHRRVGIACMTCGRAKGKHRTPCLDQRWGRICLKCGMKVL